MDRINKEIATDMEVQEGDGDAQAVVAIVELLARRLERENLLAAKDRESVSYRLAEIMMCAKELYTNRLSCLIASDEDRQKLGRLGHDTPSPDPEKNEEPPAITVFDDLAYTRMHLIRLRDLISDFDASFMEAMANQREEDGNEETWLNDPEWLENELEEEEQDEYGHDEERNCRCREDEDPWN